MKKYILTFIILISTLTGCYKEEEFLYNSVFIEDNECPGLPIYSECGYNTFGAYYGRNVFVSNNNTVPAKIIFTDSILFFNLYSDNMTLSFALYDFAPSNYRELMPLNGKEYNLRDSLSNVYIIDESDSVSVKVLSGNLLFNKVQYLYIDKESNEVCLSGYFHFKALVNNEPIAFRSGRFDIGINDDNFFVY